MAEQLNLSAEAIKKQKANLAKKLGITNTTTSFYKFAEQHRLFAALEE